MSRLLVLALALLLPGCLSQPQPRNSEVGRFAQSVQGSGCPTAKCAADAEEDQTVLEIVTL